MSLLRLLCAASALFCASVQTSLAQVTDIETAPRAETQSPTGVSYASGSFSYDIPVISAGPVGDQALSVSFYYRSGANRGLNTNWVSNQIRTSRVLIENPSSEGCGECIPADRVYLQNIVFGPQTMGASEKKGAGVTGTYRSAELDGATLRVVTAAGKTYFDYTSKNGDVYTLNGGYGTLSAGDIGSIVYANGYAQTYKYYGSIYSARWTVEDNRGFALLFETPVQSGSNFMQKIRALNLTSVSLAALTSCPASAPTATVVRGSAGVMLGNRVYSVSDAAGRAINFDYGSHTTNLGTHEHLTCVKDWRSSECTIQNSYDGCEGMGLGPGYDPAAKGSRDRVISQTLA